MNLNEFLDSDNQNSALQKIASFFAMKAKAEATRHLLSSAQLRSFFEASNVAQTDAVLNSWFPLSVDILTPYQPRPSENSEFAARCICPGHSDQVTGSFWQPAAIDLNRKPTSPKLSGETWRQALRNCPASVRSRKGWTKADVALIPGIWFEIDSQKDEAGQALTGPDLIKAELEQINRLALAFDCAPFALIFSGSKSLHAFWRYSTPLRTADDIGLKNRHEAAARQILKSIDGDESVSDSAKEMRTPGFLDARRAQPVIWFDPISTVKFEDVETAAGRLYFEKFGQQPEEKPEKPGTILTATASQVTGNALDIIKHAPPVGKLTKKSSANIETLFREAERATPGNRYDTLRNTAFFIGCARFNADRPGIPKKFLIRFLQIARRNGEIFDHFESDEAKFIQFLENAAARGREKELQKHDWQSCFEPADLSEITAGFHTVTARGEIGSYGWTVSAANDWTTYNFLMLPCGTGKSEAVARFVESQRALNPDARVYWITARRALAIAAHESFELVCYLRKSDNFETVRGDLDSDEVTDKISISIDSLWKAASNERPSILVIDEATEVLQILTKTPASTPEKQRRSLDFLRSLIFTAPEEGRTVFFCDANPLHEHIEILQSMCSECITIFEPPEDVKPFSGKKISVITEKDLFTCIAYDIVRETPFICYESKKSHCEFLSLHVKEIAERLKKTFEYETFTADNQLKKTPPLIDAIFHNMTLSSGVSIKTDHYKKVYVILGTFGRDTESDAAIGCRHFIQTALRARGAEQIVFVTPRNEKVTKSESNRAKVERWRIEKAQKAAAEFTGLDSEQVSGLNYLQSLYLSAVQRDKAETLPRVLGYLARFGASFEPLSIPETSLTGLTWRHKVNAKKFARLLDSDERWTKATTGTIAAELRRQAAHEIAERHLSQEPRSPHWRQLARLIAYQKNGLAWLQSEAVSSQTILKNGRPVLNGQTRFLPEFATLRAFELLNLIPGFWPGIESRLNWQNGRLYRVQTGPKQISFEPGTLTLLASRVHNRYSTKPTTQPASLIQRELRALFSDVLTISRKHTSHDKQTAVITVDLDICADQIAEIAPIIEATIDPNIFADQERTNEALIKLNTLKESEVKAIETTSNRIKAADLTEFAAILDTASKPVRLVDSDEPETPATEPPAKKQEKRREETEKKGTKMQQKRGRPLCLKSALKKRQTVIDPQPYAITLKGKTYYLPYLAPPALATVSMEKNPDKPARPSDLPECFYIGDEIECAAQKIFFFTVETRLSPGDGFYLTAPAPWPDELRTLQACRQLAQKLSAVSTSGAFSLTARPDDSKSEEVTAAFFPTWQDAFFSAAGLTAEDADELDTEFADTVAEFERAEYMRENPDLARLQGIKFKISA